MKLSVPILELFHYPTSELRKHIESLADEMWLIDSHRQQKYPVHRETRSIVFRWLDNDWKEGQQIRVVEQDYAPKPLITAVNGYAARLVAHYGGGLVVKLMLAELRPGGRIAPHRDGAPALYLAHRCHLPVITDAGVGFYVDDVSYSLKESTAYEFDNTRVHAVHNGSASKRVHLICDVMPS